MTDFGVPCLLIRRTNSKKGAPGGSVTDNICDKVADIPNPVKTLPRFAKMLIHR